jgi:hypothetical protein
MCSAGEINAYVSSLVNLINSAASGGAVQPLSNLNCNLTHWDQGCEDGWSKSLENVQSMSDLYENDTDIPFRGGIARPCCEGFFCPRGLPCMIRKHL